MKSSVGPENVWSVHASLSRTQALTVPSEIDVYDRFAEHGDIKQMQLPLDRRTGFVKGYALIEYEKKQEAQKAIESENGKELMEHVITAEWAFSKGPIKGRESTRRRTD